MDIQTYTNIYDNYAMVDFDCIRKTNDNLVMYLWPSQPEGITYIKYT